MKNNFLKLFFVLIATSAFSQVGINTQTPKATFEVVGKPDDTGHYDGIIPPRITGDQIAAKSFSTAQIGKTNKVVFSHISNGQDFYRYEPENWDIIISNPPFTNKRKIFERCLNFNKPFALLMSNTWLNDAAPKQLFMQKELQLLMFDQRIKFSCKGIVNNKITYSSSYYCWNFLPKQLIMEKINTTKTIFDD